MLQRLQTWNCKVFVISKHIMGLGSTLYIDKISILFENNFMQPQGVMQGKLIAVVYNLRTH